MKPWPYPLWIAHRGAGKLAPENTLAAFRKGAAHGYRMFECDVKLSADGVPFLMHDATLERTTSGRGTGGDRPWAELSMLDAGSWHSRRYAGEPLANLREHRALLPAQRPHAEHRDQAHARHGAAHRQGGRAARAGALDRADAAAALADVLRARRAGRRARRRRPSFRAACCSTPCGTVGSTRRCNCAVRRSSATTRCGTRTPSRKRGKPACAP